MSLKDVVDVIGGYPLGSLVVALLCAAVMTLWWKDMPSVGRGLLAAAILLLLAGAGYGLCCLDTFDDKTLRATQSYFSAGRKYLRASDIAVTCAAGRCSVGFIAATCAKEYLPNENTGPSLSIVLTDSAGKKLSNPIGAGRAWVRNKDDYNPINYELPQTWIAPRIWNAANSVDLGPGWTTGRPCV